MPVGIILTFILGISAWFIYMHRKYPNKEEANPYADYDHIIKNIDSCGNFAELCTCCDWVDSMEYKLDPKALIRLKLRMKEKEEELVQNLSIITGENIKKVQ